MDFSLLFPRLIERDWRLHTEANNLQPLPGQWIAYLAISLLRTGDQQDPVGGSQVRTFLHHDLMAPALSIRLHFKVVHLQVKSGGPSIQRLSLSFSKRAVFVHVHTFQLEPQSLLVRSFSAKLSNNHQG